jgi:hypothetical protein
MSEEERSTVNTISLLSSLGIESHEAMMKGVVNCVSTVFDVTSHDIAKVSEDLLKC